MTATIRVEGRSIAVRDGETVLDALVREGVGVLSSCRSGVCQTCLVRAVEGEVPARARVGLKDSMSAQGYFLSCVCVPSGDLSLELVGASLDHEAVVVGSDDIGAAVRRLRLAVPGGFSWFAGQYVTIVRGDGVARSYSVASSPADGFLELHVRRIPGGAMSNWLHDDVRPGDTLRFRGPAGDCLYTPGDEDAPLLLAGTGTGLAPLYGIARDALRHGHRGPIALYHGALAESGLYLREELGALAADGAIAYHPCVLRHEGEPAGGMLVGALDAVVLGLPIDLKRSRAFLCGDPALVEGMRRKLFLKGLSSRRIHADAFVPAAAPAG